MTTTTSGTVLEVGATAGSSYREVIEDRGHAVVGCGGPDGGRCPLVEDGSCSMVDSAQGVVFRLDLDDDYNRQILTCYRKELGPDVSIQVMAKPGDEVTYADDLRGTVVLTEDSDSAVDHFSHRVALAEMARQALTDLVGRPTRSSRSQRTEDGQRFHWHP